MTAVQRVVLVTGASGGIGAGIAERLSEDGWDVAVHGHANLERAAAVRDRIRAAGGRSESYLADLSDEKAVGDLFDSVMRDFGDIDAVISNHGIFPRSLVVDMSVEEWDRVQATNLRSMFLVCRAAARHFKRRGSGGRIVTTASGAAARGLVLGAHYAASKAGVVGFTKTLALELAADHIFVNCVAPGTIDTPMPRGGGTTEAALEERARTFVPLRRMGKPSDVAEVVAFLLGERLTWMTGQTIWINGGDLML
jgi:NAD(P)-dependent dehydrogenase (short-subunit alcohol dehydrogenase family)